MRTDSTGGDATGPRAELNTRPATPRCTDGFDLIRVYGSVRVAS
jgi:hypothetical protein